MVEMPYSYRVKTNKGHALSGFWAPFPGVAPLRERQVIFFIQMFFSSVTYLQSAEPLVEPDDAAFYKQIPAYCFFNSLAGIR